MKIIIAGGSGFLGKSLVDFWKDKNYDLFILTRNQQAKIKSPLPNVQYITWNPVTTGDWISQLENSDVIINLVGQSLASGFRWTKGVKRKLLESRTIPTRTLASAVGQLTDKPKMFIQISGVNYYDFSFDIQD